MKKRLSDFKYGTENIDIEKLASLLRAFNLEPSAKEVGAKAILNDDDAYQALFGVSPLDITQERVKEMILAYNIFNLLETESKLLNKILKLLLHLDERQHEFGKVKKLIEDSLALNTVVKSKFKDYETYSKNRERNKKNVRKISAFSQGKYFTLAIFRLVLDECDYLESLTNTELFRDKEFIKVKMVAIWLPTVLTKLLIREYERAVTADAISIGAFYLRPKSFDNIYDMFEQLDAEENKEFTDLFPLNV